MLCMRIVIVWTSKALVPWPLYVAPTRQCHDGLLQVRLQNGKDGYQLGLRVLGALAEVRSQVPFHDLVDEPVDGAAYCGQLLEDRRTLSIAFDGTLDGPKLPLNAAHPLEQSV